MEIPLALIAFMVMIISVIPKLIEDSEGQDGDKKSG